MICSKELIEYAITGAYILGWYILNVLYNIYNKQVLIFVNLPWTMSIIQLAIGVVYVIINWMFRLRVFPSLSTKLVVDTFIQGTAHLMVHFGAVVAFSYGHVSFVHIIKSLEPVFVAICSFTLLNVPTSRSLLYCLLPIMLGVSLASISDTSFSFSAFIFAQISNIGAGLRGVLSKRAMKESSNADKLSPTNALGLLTISSLIIGIPISLILEPPSVIISTWREAAVNMAENSNNDLTVDESYKSLIVLILLSGITYYLYNEVSFLVLDRVAPVSHSVINALKRVAIISCAVIVFNTPLSILSVMGCLLAVSGGGLYAYVGEKEKQKKNEWIDRESEHSTFQPRLNYIYSNIEMDTGGDELR